MHPTDPAYFAFVAIAVVTWLERDLHITTAILGAIGLLYYDCEVRASGSKGETDQ